MKKWLCAKRNNNIGVWVAIAVVLMTTENSARREHPLSGWAVGVGVSVALALVVLAVALVRKCRAA